MSTRRGKKSDAVIVTNPNNGRYHTRLQVRLERSRRRLWTLLPDCLLCCVAEFLHCVDLGTCCELNKHSRRLFAEDKRWRRHADTVYQALRATFLPLLNVEQLNRLGRLFDARTLAVPPTTHLKAFVLDQIRLMLPRHKELCLYDDDDDDTSRQVDLSTRAHVADAVTVALERARTDDKYRLELPFVGKNRVKYRSEQYATVFYVVDKEEAKRLRLLYLPAFPPDPWPNPARKGRPRANPVFYVDRPKGVPAHRVMTYVVMRTFCWQEETDVDSFTFLDGSAPYKSDQSFDVNGDYMPECIYNAANGSVTVRLSQLVKCATHYCIPLDEYPLTLWHEQHLPATDSDSDL